MNFRHQYILSIHTYQVPTMCLGVGQENKGRLNSKIVTIN